MVSARLSLSRKYFGSDRLAKTLRKSCENLTKTSRKPCENLGILEIRDYKSWGTIICERPLQDQQVLLGERPMSSMPSTVSRAAFDRFVSINFSGSAIPPTPRSFVRSFVCSFVRSFVRSPSFFGRRPLVAMVLTNFCVPRGPRFGGAVRRGPPRHAKIDFFFFLLA